MLIISTCFLYRKWDLTSYMKKEFPHIDVYSTSGKHIYDKSVFIQTNICISNNIVLKVENCQNKIKISCCDLLHPREKKILLKFIKKAT